MNSIFTEIYNDRLFQIIVSAIVAAIVSVAAIPVIIKISRLKNLMAEPGERSSHIKKTPTLGGVAIFASTLISYFLWSNPDEGEFVHLSISAMVILFFLGVKDDILVLSPKKKMYVQIAASALVVVFGDVRLENLFGIFGIDEVPYLLSLPLTVFVFIALINAINLIDGIDGLAGGIGMICGGLFGLWFYLNGYFAMACLAASMAGSLFGFLRFNYSKTSKIFMGDTGSLIVGFLLTMFAIKFVQLNIAYRFDPNALFSAPILAIVVLIVPIFDTLRVFIVRLKDKKSPFVGDRNHLHHILIDSGMTHLQASMVLWVFTVVSTIAFLFITKNSDNTTSLYILGGLFGVYMWLSHILKARNAKRQELLEAEEAEAKRQKEIQEQQAIILEEKKLAKPALEIR
ncbi:MULTISPECIES: glycosyltransferase family 4 protein [Flectobacillus]|jgi:UDP-N-acetylmuramyl pentapeptide phosphotransferase/UDP-N-acetylglucosamine-1-phosphate transferase|uniref:MraY family glycosyltransferase n=1 Tax=Flectobacillus roseus TaxID=502259 RepID=A0ABT6Y8X3_9BACT|nr:MULTISPECIES: MraY family glycosyltransferase [Flectobacillus]MDI9859706.1 MraY family glycosyltransferase [Flectobacillus roseus]MDI9868818.1 MraY family glycosyltransferase [Flectobacillus roseus]NBA74230.1 undecaprenyl/decaprenyl-phosphate alpha-N-acetylglucosaminyl 1-phosphate transferase [Emticicia sp. ODNR4P]PAC30705.1 undecaprenyl-phosphate alpha-N-acetylglucosaminyl 1-phosphate transferase [Flectobacillus sp. BAB-3569]